MLSRNGNSIQPPTRTFRYPPLQTTAREIRVLILRPGKFNDEICIDLEHMSLPKERYPIRYRALSYVWGSEDTARPVTVDSAPSGQNTILVTQNLDIALRHLRNETQESRLWIDALCIDQSNLVERSHQVALMGDIYRLSGHTTIWLGPEADDSKHALNLLLRAGNMVEVDWTTHTMEPSIAGYWEPHWADASRVLPFSSRDMRAISAFFGRGWFSRLWVRQEVFLCNAKTVWCGRDSIPWMTFRRAVFCLYPRDYISVEWTFDAIFFERRRIVYELCISQSHYLTYAGLRHGLRDLRWKDPRDAIYATLQLLRPADRLDIQPDYTKSAASIYEDVAKRTAVDLHDLSFLSSCEADSDSLPGLPTWVPNWCKPPKTSTRITQIWSACGWISAHVKHCDNGMLRATGVRVCDIQTIHKLPSITEEFDWDATWRAIKGIIQSANLQTAYIGGGTLSDAYCLALHNGRTADNFAKRNGSALTMATANKMLNELETMKKVPSRKPYNDAREHFLTEAHKVFVGRSFFSNADGYIGLVPAAAKAGDVIAVLLGVDIPLVLRELTDGSKRWIVVGECLVPGLMFGEAIHGAWPNSYTPIRGHPKGSLINGHRVAMLDSADWSCKSDPSEMLRERGIEPTRYVRDPHLLEVSPEALIKGGVKVQDFDLV